MIELDFTCENLVGTIRMNRKGCVDRQRGILAMVKRGKARFVYGDTMDAFKVRCLFCEERVVDLELDLEKEKMELEILRLKGNYYG